MAKNINEGIKNPFPVDFREDPNLDESIKQKLVTLSDVSQFSSHNAKRLMTMDWDDSGYDRTFHSAQGIAKTMPEHLKELVGKMQESLITGGNPKSINNALDEVNQITKDTEQTFQIAGASLRRPDLAWKEELLLAKVKVDINKAMLESQQQYVRELHNDNPNHDSKIIAQNSFDSPALPEDLRVHGNKITELYNQLPGKDAKDVDMKAVADTFIEISERGNQFAKVAEKTLLNMGIDPNVGVAAVEKVNHTIGNAIVARSDIEHNYGKLPHTNITPHLSGVSDDPLKNALAATTDLADNLGFIVSDLEKKQSNTTELKSDSYKLMVLNKNMPDPKLNEYLEGAENAFTRLKDLHKLQDMKSADPNISPDAYKMFTGRDMPDIGGGDLDKMKRQSIQDYAMYSDFSIHRMDGALESMNYAQTYVAKDIARDMHSMNRDVKSILNSSIVSSRHSPEVQEHYTHLKEDVDIVIDSTQSFNQKVMHQATMQKETKNHMEIDQDYNSPSM